MNPHILMAIAAELDAAKEKHPVWYTCNIQRAAVVIGEAGEALKEAIKIDEGKGSIQNLRTELIQTAAMCVRMLEAMEEDEKPPAIFYTNNL